MKLIDILERHFHLNTIRFSFKVHRIMDHLFFCIQFPDKSKDSIGFMVLNMFRLLAPSVFKNNCKLRVQIRSLMHPALYFIRPESGLFKYRIIREKIHLCPGLPGLPDHRQKTVLQLDHRLSFFISVVVNISVPADLHITSAGLIYRIIKFTAGMQRRVDYTRSRYACGMQIHRHPAAVIGNCRRPVFFKDHMDLTAESCQVLVH